VTGRTGVALAEQGAPDLILMDIQLPGLDGYEATRRIKGTTELSAHPIIVVTSYALSGDDVKAFEAAATRTSQAVRAAGPPGKVAGYLT
jgi:two-component system cell cycle response regulator DivK